MTDKIIIFLVFIASLLFTCFFKIGNTYYIKNISKLTEEQKQNKLKQLNFIFTFLLIVTLYWLILIFII